MLQHWDQRQVLQKVYRDIGNDNSLQKVMGKVSRYTFSRVVQLGAWHGALEFYSKYEFQKKDYNHEYDQSETVDDLLKGYIFCEIG